MCCTIFDDCYNSVKKVKEHAFDGCRNLVKITVQNPKTSFGDEVFAGHHKNLVISGSAASKADTYAKNNHIKFESTTPVTPVNKITLNKKKLSLKIGEKITLKATVSPSKATYKKVTWKTNNSKVATIKDGKVTAVAPGEAMITASTPEGKSASCTVTVKTPKLSVKSNSKAVLKANSKSGKVNLSSKLGKGDKYTLTVSSDLAWKLKASDTSWFTLSKAKGSAGKTEVVLKLKKVTYGKTYTSELTFTIKGIKKKLTIALKK